MFIFVLFYLYLRQIQRWMNNWRSYQVVIGNIWFCFVLLCGHPMATCGMTWEWPSRTTCWDPMTIMLTDIWCSRMSIEFVFLSLLPLCLIFEFFLSFPEEGGRYYPNGLRLDFLFYLFPGYKLPPFITQIRQVSTDDYHREIGSDGGRPRA